VARGFVLHLFGLDNTPLGQRRAAGLPIRIGRNPLNDCQISDNFVSDFHARIEDEQGRISIRDLGSKNGIFLRSDKSRPPSRLAPQTPVDLGPYGFEFFIGPMLRVQLEIVNVDSYVDRDPKSSGAVLGNRQIMQPGPSIPPPGGPGYTPAYQPMPPMRPVATSPAPQPGAGLSPLPPLDRPLTNNSGAPLPMRAPPGPGAAMGPPGYAGSAPAFQAPQAPYQGGPTADAPAGFARTGHFALGADALAVQGLRELAGSLVPGQPLETSGDFARLITKLHDAIEVFCRCFIPLRDGYAQFVSSMDLQRASMQRSVNRSASYMGIELASNPAEVAAALLNWREKSFDAPKAIEGIFADLMVHQVALLDGVMQGVRALLDELSPENVAKALDGQGRGPLGLSLGRHKALWEMYCERYEQLSEEKQAFGHIFGAEFTEAYREYRRRKPDTNRP
jgi:type VI secretion system protein ImpI